VPGPVLFGIGFGLAGLCPGPALASLGDGGPGGQAFLAATIAGRIAAPPVRAWVDGIAAAS